LAAQTFHFARALFFGSADDATKRSDAIGTSRPPPCGAVEVVGGGLRFRRLDFRKRQQQLCSTFYFEQQLVAAVQLQY